MPYFGGEIRATGYRGFGIKGWRGVIMSEIRKNSTPLPQKAANQPSSTDHVISEQLEKDANKMAGTAGKAENK